METYWLCFRLLSDATFGRGEGMAGVVDQEVEHDTYGLPYLRGRTLKGLLNEECANILYALRQPGRDMTHWTEAAQRLFGGPGSKIKNDARLRVGAAQLPLDVRRAVQSSRVPTADVLESLTTIRQQTAVDETTGAPAEGTLRAMRVVLRQTPFEAPLTLLDDDPSADLPLLAACVMALRRAGVARNRGRGHLQATLHLDEAGRPGADVTRIEFERFKQEVGA